ncbi:hypothetical protein RF11_08577 [Thelohanellus kitauei]|uniref:Secreted protein n=1 Tax=Thelohanellus kitauei TaxID=669202 RepID=A0A0C2M3S5_THEKT|nr:hypothetical protein RF11_08577 [Thelohanellus kitauei]
MTFSSTVIVIFAFNWLLTTQHLLRNFLQSERPASCEALVGFEKVIQLDLPVLMHLLLGRQIFPDLNQLPILCLSLDLLFNEFGIRETVTDRRFTDLLPSTSCDV